jgi:2-methylfumaryl-CoA isomerase
MIREAVEHGKAEAIAALARETGLDLSRAGNRFHARAAITELFAPWFAARTLAEIGPLFDAAGLTWAPFRSFAQAVHEDPDLGPENPMIGMVDQPGIGTFPVAGSPVSWGALPRQPPAPAPRLGQHTEEILADVLGLGSGQIGALRDKGVVAGA